ncbi:hypothetical protein HZY62_04305 [Maribacter polysiphoniae]|uniref:Secreted protein n=1 Tax=Maribacter polysiphoniae TaxID=429344 RepID=A0A316E051_9FLAO|nr:hypothetical protein [Maribacter polysiphoniae]MBD1259799.1 hypothetical protein [Maribacter polysiphoniae]PWK23058.1 hypothetical protein LX92_02387 [Maribacter polysiphoniae]
MKKILIAILVIAMNTVFFSCKPDSVAESDALYNMQAAEGDDGDIPPPPPEGL